MVRPKRLMRQRQIQNSSLSQRKASFIDDSSDCQKFFFNIIPQSMTIKYGWKYKYENTDQNVLYRANLLKVDARIGSYCRRNNFCNYMHHHASQSTH